MLGSPRKRAIRGGKVETNKRTASTWFNAGCHARWDRRDRLGGQASRFLTLHAGLAQELLLQSISEPEIAEGEAMDLAHGAALTQMGGKVLDGGSVGVPILHVAVAAGYFLISTTEVR